MRILGIETSCDETAAAVVEDGRIVRSNVIASSRDAFARTGGVIPEEAARRQLECIQPVIAGALADAGTSMDDIDAVAVTHAPGLLGSLLVGTIAARTLAWIQRKPLIPVHHTLGHLSSPWLGLETGDSPSFPIITLSASGGHTELWHRTSHTHGTLLGQTRDDAAGEAFDKGASLLGLPYPGGPAIAAAAAAGNPHAFPFPVPLASDDSFDWSFSGLKTALKYLLRDDPSARDRLPDLAASFEHAVCFHLVDKLENALQRYADVREVHLVGGVSANVRLRDMVVSLGKPTRWPTARVYCTDNGAMIAGAAYFLQLETPAAVDARFDTSANTPLSLR